MSRLLNLSHNLVSSLPDEVGSLVLLEGLAVDGNKLTALPETLGGCWVGWKGEGECRVGCRGQEGGCLGVCKLLLHLVGQAHVFFYQVAGWSGVGRWGRPVRDVSTLQPHGSQEGGPASHPTHHSTCVHLTPAAEL